MPANPLKNIPSVHELLESEPLKKMVEDGQVDHGMLFHTYLQAVGVDSTDTFDIDGRDVPIADPAAAPVDELLT